jgi:uncharacterized protein (DUF2147 family)
MNFKALPLALTLMALAASAAGAASPADGLWAGPEHGVVIRVETCGDALCGYIVTSNRIAANPNLLDEHNPDSSLRARRLKGLALFSGLKGGPPEWRGGSAYDVGDGKTYHASLRLKDPNTMILTGCIVAPLCQSQTWVRVKP